MQELRAHVRRLLDADAAIADSTGKQWRSVQMLDISGSGVAFASNEPVESGASHMFNFYLPGTSRRNEVVLKIVECNEGMTNGRYRIGARFTAIDDDSRAIIKQFVGD